MRIGSATTRTIISKVSRAHPLLSMVLLLCLSPGVGADSVRGDGYIGCSIYPLGQAGNTLFCEYDDLILGPSVYVYDEVQSGTSVGSYFTFVRIQYRDGTFPTPVCAWETYFTGHILFPTITNEHILCWNFSTGGLSAATIEADTDGDYIVDDYDNCPSNSNGSQSDQDDDGIGDPCDADRDGDGLDNVVDNCPQVINPDQLNFDGDSYGDLCDYDDDNDSVHDAADDFPFNDAAALDSDGDGMPDDWNAGCDLSCQSASGLILDDDDDNDLLLDIADNCTTVANPEQENYDLDALGDACDSDDDNDGVSDNDDDFDFNEAAAVDTDGDGMPDNWLPGCDTTCQNNSGLTLDDDDDNDGVVDLEDSFPLDATRSGGNTNILYMIYGDVPNIDFGKSVSGAGDVNGDGHADFIAGARRGVNDTYMARVYSGYDGSQLYSFNETVIEARWGISVGSVGDVNLDNYDDVIVGTWSDGSSGSYPGYAYVYSGVDGTILYSLQGNDPFDDFGFSVDGAGDVNNDNYVDFIIGSPADDDNGYDAGSARVYSGLDGSELYVFYGVNSQDLAGYSVSGLGDVNQDGYDDVIVGVVFDDTAGNNAGAARVYSGFDGTVIYTFYGAQADILFGYSVDGPGDINNDGYVDMIVGARDENNTGSATVFSGMDGSVLFKFFGDAANDKFGAAVSAAGDVNRDGYRDFLVGAFGDSNQGSASGSARVYSGLDGSVIYTFNGDDWADWLGIAVGAAGDVNGDGYDDVIVGAIGDDDNGSRSGTVRVYSGRGYWMDSDGDGLNNAVDIDDDNDGILDLVDLESLSGDSDRDGLLDSVDWDDDGDGVLDIIDAAPLDNTVTTEVSLPLNSTFKGLSHQSRD